MKARSTLQRLASLRNWAIADIKGQRSKLMGLQAAKLITCAQFSQADYALDKLEEAVNTNWHRLREQ